MRSELSAPIAGYVKERLVLKTIPMALWVLSDPSLRTRCDGH